MRTKEAAAIAGFAAFVALAFALPVIRVCDRLRPGAFALRSIFFQNLLLVAN